jgi:tRNA-2-methylthio-N6-dimethylallyladenosine synthase
VEEINNGKSRLAAVGQKERPIKKDKGSYRTEKVRAFVNISEGCNNFCSYCIVPYVRGNEVSRPAQDIIDEIKNLVGNGTREIMLLGQNVNSYRDGDKNFVKLLKLINNIEGLKRIRFMTSHPKDAGIELFRAMREFDKVCEHIHLPLQSGSDRILKAMNRGYTVSHYLKLVADFRKELADSSLTTDVIVGFPGETEEDFKETYMLMKEIKFDSAFIFKYSPRPLTKASQLKDDVPKEVKEERHQILLKLQYEINSRNDEKLVGKIENPLGVSCAKRRPHSAHDYSAVYIKGYTRKNRQLIYKGSKELIGEISKVRINDIENHTLIGELT